MVKGVQLDIWKDGGQLKGYCQGFLPGSCPGETLGNKRRAPVGKGMPPVKKYWRDT